MNFKNLLVKMFGMFVPSCDYQEGVLKYLTQDMCDYYSKIFSEVLGYDCRLLLWYVRGRSFHETLMVFWAEGFFRSKESKDFFASHMVEYVVPIRIPLYRGIPDNGISSMGFACESWTKEQTIAKRFGGGWGERRVYRVDYVYGIDLEKFMYGYGYHSPYSHEREVIVFWRDRVELFDKVTAFLTRRSFRYVWDSQASEDMKKRKQRMKKRRRLSK